ncbi:hypothetical protein Acor_73150 [Acrocarpospora corrugata]|uniref:Uncharacterized protein n=1 Tax=Acrocarpospora corrugata TaxID=35763 RepID=A0A5M3W848_9ACTN|nr:hypothetical protein Acor_73150 [Acrocarpospora corrugata]
MKRLARSWIRRSGRGLRPFDRMRRRRNDAEYPRRDSDGFNAGDVDRDIPKVEEIIQIAVKVVDQMQPY